MALVIHSPDIDYPVELAANKLVVVIGDVAGEVSWGAIRSDDNLILFIAGIVAGQKPAGAVPFYDFAVSCKLFKQSVYEALVIQAFLAEPAVESYAPALTVLP